MLSSKRKKGFCSTPEGTAYPFGISPYGCDGRDRERGAWSEDTLRRVEISEENFLILRASKLGFDCSFLVDAVSCPQERV
jgi:hypothetical protein